MAHSVTVRQRAAGPEVVRRTLLQFEVPCRCNHPSANSEGKDGTPNEWAGFHDSLSFRSDDASWRHNVRHEIDLGTGPAQIVKGAIGS